MLSDQSMTDTLTISNDINILLMDGMGGLTDNKYINELPVRLMLNYPTTNENDEVVYSISLLNPDNRLTSKLTGFLDIWEKDFAPLLPIRDIPGEWKLKIELTGSIIRTEEFILILR